MVTIEKMDTVEKYNKEELRLLVDEYVAAHPKLSFRPEYFDRFYEYIEKVKESVEKEAYIAKDGNKVIGLIIGYIDDNSRMMYPDKVGYVPFLSVLSEYREKSVGKRLWNELKKWYEENNIEEVELYTMVDNEAAKQFWEKYEFQPHLERRRLVLKV